MLFEQGAVLFRHDDTRRFLGGSDGEPQRHEGHRRQEDLKRGWHFGDENGSQTSNQR
jgi:hypothetical protein